MSSDGRSVGIMSQDFRKLQAFVLVCRSTTKNFLTGDGICSVCCWSDVNHKRFQHLCMYINDIFLKGQMVFEFEFDQEQGFERAASLVMDYY